MAFPSFLKGSLTAWSLPSMSQYQRNVKSFKQSCLFFTLGGEAVKADRYDLCSALEQCAQVHSLSNIRVFLPRRIASRNPKTPSGMFSREFPQHKPTQPACLYPLHPSPSHSTPDKTRADTSRQQYAASWAPQDCDTSCGCKQSTEHSGICLIL